MSSTLEQLKARLERDLSEHLSGKYLMFDTCVMSKLSSVGDGEKSITAEIFSFANRINCIPGVSEYIQVEFLRSHQNYQKFIEAQKFLDKFAKKRLGENDVPNFYENMITIDRINQKHDLKGASFVDLTSAVFLQHWPNSLFFVTANIKDFLCGRLFDIISVIPVISGHTTNLLGVIKANKDGFIEERGKLG